MSEADSLWRVLLTHELRLAWRQLRLDRWSSVTGGHITLLCLVVIFLHLFVWIFVALLPRESPVSPAATAWIGSMMLTFATLMLATALSRSVEALFERNDLDLLFAAPVSPRAVLFVRTLSVAAITVFLHSIYLLPLANMAMITGRTWLWTLYLVTPLVALFAAALGMLASLSMVKLIGARRTRTLVQVIAVAAGAFAFVVTQFGSRAVRSLDFAAPSSLINALGWPASLILGNPVALLVLLVACGVTCVLTWTQLDHVFLRGSQETMTAQTRKRRPKHRRMAVANSLLTSVCRKEWRGIARDPLLLTRIGTSLIYLAPALVICLRRDGSGAGFDAIAVAGICVLFASMLAQQLASLAINMEDAPHLVLASPRRVPDLLTAKATAAFIPATALALILLCACAALLDMKLLLVTPIVAAAAWASTSIVASRVRLTSRQDFGKRAGRLDFATGLIALIVGFAFTATGAVLMTPYEWAAIPLLAVACMITWLQGRRIGRLRADTLITTDR